MVRLTPMASVHIKGAPQYLAQGFIPGRRDALALLLKE
jgi:hypothetical protein